MEHFIDWFLNICFLITLIHYWYSLYFCSPELKIDKKIFEIEEQYLNRNVTFHEKFGNTRNSILELKSMLRNLELQVERLQSQVDLNEKYIVIQEGIRNKIKRHDFENLEHTDATVAAYDIGYAEGKNAIKDSST